MKNKLIRKKSIKQERRTAREFNGSTTIASGALWLQKADVKTGSLGERGTGFNDEDFLIENKFTDAPYYSLKLSTWEKINKEAIRNNLRIPLMQIDIQDIQLVVLSNNDFFAIVRESLAFKEESTRKKSIRLVRNELSYLKYSREFHTISFDAAECVLVVMDKDLFLSLI